MASRGCSAYTGFGCNSSARSLRVEALVRVTPVQRVDPSRLAQRDRGERDRYRLRPRETSAQHDFATTDWDYQGR